MTIQGKFDEIKAWACHGKDEKVVPFTYKARPLGENDVEIEISHCGICGSDLHTMDSGWGPSQYPVVPGHEIIGTITATGSRVTNLKIGDRVGVGAQVGACLRSDCKQCPKGIDNLCSQRESCEFCGSKKDVFCPERVMTYNDKWADNEKSYGGYAEAIRLNSRLVFHIPESLPSEYAAPLMCAGVSVFAPMIRYGVQPGDAVGITGIGGLGHLALQYASKLGAEVYALSRSEDKRQEALDLGANQYVNTSDPEQIKDLKNKLKFLIVANNNANVPWDLYINFIKIEGRMIILGVPENSSNIYTGAIVRKSISISGSFVGSIHEIQQTLEFSAKHNIRPLINEFSMSQVNEGVQHVKDGKVRFRAVLKN
ncbi:putative mannitol dehydrogenase [Conidiobolus coronatus NRRL 28638]|uniref:Putative mannitol dehydrogenase n=1 Tax=Conidiobolus coronatus (strain ATCC 28846 / CBS 209.66 / NRRL 28638) TaxID=796925 RepID=A0A137PAN2_CONC2|nr:putative mannitol dehydrogenase [Conidiobolus coronatus NRRL 28638]|eukprot:KXN72073.1 putative mannitol dehydrogenase [Conidiobolus coronatus NRRL 28638]